jgi:DNA-binding NarL/FixJ family response regulator
MKKIKVLIVDDQLLIRGGIKFHVNEMEEVTVLGEAENGQEFLDFIRKKMPDVVLMDVKMPVMDGIEATRLAIKDYPDLKVLVLSSQDDEENLTKMLAEGVKGYVLKNVSKEELRDAILKVSDGKNYFSPELIPTLTRALMHKETKAVDEDVYKALTKREVEILQYICQGFTDKEIGEKCFISSRTAGGHRFNLLKKTGSRNTVGLMFFAIKHGLIKG